jgi:hypothetical protein
MRQGIWRSSPALVISALALFTALGGSVYAAKKTRIDGKTIRVKSIPGNRLKPRSIAANRLKPGVLPTTAATTAAVTMPLTGAEINELTLGKVPSAAYADEANEAEHAVVADSAINALDAQTVNGHSAGCLPSTLAFAGACWESSASAPATAPLAAARCAERGGSLPEALQLAAFGEQPGGTLDEDDEWTSDLTNVSGPNAFGVVTISSIGVVDIALSTNVRAYRCAIPLLR